MWKSATITLKSTFKKGVVRCNTVLSTNALQNKDLQGLLNFTPFLLQNCSRFYNFCRGTTENFTKEKKEDPKEKKASFLEYFDNDLIDALKWSGVFALGYFTILQYKLKASLSQELYDDRVRSKAPYYHKSLAYLVNAAGIKPYNCVFPEVQAAKSKNGGQKDSAANLKSEERDFNGLENAHKKVLGALNNLLGTQCMQSGQHKEAFEYFTQAAEEDHVPGIFNLGICHEKGLGTSQNLQKASELYKKAADRGHATAMYNLGVFYAQGRGKIQADMDQARKLFKAAASLGQVDALRALNLEKQAAEDVADCNSQEISGKMVHDLNQLIYKTILGETSSESFKQFNDSEVKDPCHSFGIPFKGKEITSSLDSDSGVLDLSPHNEFFPVLA